MMGTLSSKILEHLVTQTIKGDMKSRQFLSDMAKKEAEAKEEFDHGPLRSQALAWAAEPPWQDVVDPKQAETCGGSREVE